MVTEKQGANGGGYATRRVDALAATKARLIFKCYSVISYVTTESLVIVSNAYLRKNVTITINTFFLQHIQDYQTLNHWGPYAI